MAYCRRTRTVLAALPVVLALAGCTDAGAALGLTSVADVSPVVQPVVPPAVPPIVPATTTSSSVSPLLAGQAVGQGNTGLTVAPPTSKSATSTAASARPATRPACSTAGLRGFSRTVPLTVTAGPGVLTVRWPYGGDPAVRGYRVTALAQDLVPGAMPPSPVTVRPAAGCRATTLGVTVRGLARGAGYVLLVDAVTVNGYAGAAQYWSGTSSTTDTQIARSPAVLTR